MKKRCRFYFVLIITILFGLQSSCSFGQQKSIKDLKNSTPEQRADFQTKLMKAKLKLDAGELTKVQAINLKYARKFEPIIKSNDNRFSKLKQAMALQKEKDQELQAVFNKDQFNQYQEFEQELRSKMKARFKQ